jgi:AcrR family transcriptional regulator
MTTRQKIINIAIEEFAKSGYENTTVRTICTRANANVAAINYHFSSKKDLYRHIMEHVLSHGQKVKMPDGNAIKSQEDLEKHLFEWIFLFLKRLTDRKKPGSNFKMNLLMNELMNPSELFDELFTKYLQKDLNSLKNILRCGLPADVQEKEVNIRLFSVLGKCGFYLSHKHIVTIVTGDPDFALNNLETIAAQICKESLQGVKY